jgi:hypothetical protein
MFYIRFVVAVWSIAFYNGGTTREWKIQEIDMWVSLCVPVVKLMAKLDNKAKVIL